MTRIFFVPGIPRPQTRPRVYRNGGVQTDGTSVGAWKRAVGIYAMAHAPRGLIGPVSLMLEFSLPVPRGRAIGEAHIVRPDVDNLVKAVMDALSTAGVWQDDAQIYSVDAEKRYRHPPGVRIRIDA